VTKEANPGNKGASNSNNSYCNTQHVKASFQSHGNTYSRLSITSVSVVKDNCQEQGHKSNDCPSRMIVQVEEL
jgi:hypothetical protein